MSETIETNPQNEAPVTTMSVGIRWGVYIGIVSIASFLILNLVGLSSSEGPGQWISYAILLAAVFLAHKYYKDNGNGYMTYGQGLGIAFWQGAVASVITTIFIEIYIAFIDTSFIENLIQKQREGMEAKNMSSEQIDQAMHFVTMFMTPTAFAITGVVFGIIGYLIGGLIISIFTQKKNAEATFN